MIIRLKKLGISCKASLGGYIRFIVINGTDIRRKNNILYIRFVRSLSDLSTGPVVNIFWKGM